MTVTPYASPRRNAASSTLRAASSDEIEAAHAWRLALAEVDPDVAGMRQVALTEDEREFDRTMG